MEAVLDAYGLKYFRMSELAQSTGQFKGWKDQEQRRIPLLDALIGLLKRRTLHWFGACVLSSDYDCVDADYHLHEFARNYALCETTITETVSTWRENQLFEKVRKSLERLHEMPCYWGQFREQDLRGLCRIHPRLRLWRDVSAGSCRKFENGFSGGFSEAT